LTARFSNPFTSRTVSFLRSITRNNDREWFRAHRDEYERHVRGPMTTVVERLANDFRRFAPELVASPRLSLYRIYRDTRFSENKKPLKTHAAAIFPWRGLPKHEGAGLYFEIAGGWIWMGGGMYHPEPPHLHRVRTHIADTWPEIERTVRGRAFRTCFGQVEGDRLTRLPRGFAADHPAAEYLKYRQFIAGREFPATFAHSREFYPTLLTTFRTLMPLVRFLNAPLVNDVAGQQHARPEGRALQAISTRPYDSLSR
jgi:uncharacterized protein (TIGR02453 family)